MRVKYSAVRFLQKMTKKQNRINASEKTARKIMVMKERSVSIV